MKGIRRFQRTIITVLLGINVLVLTQSLYKDFSVSLWYAVLAMCIAGTLLVSASFLRKNEWRKHLHRMPGVKENKAE